MESPTSISFQMVIVTFPLFQNEAGDILVQLIYNDLGSVEVLVKSVKLPSNMDNVSGLFNIYLSLLKNSSDKCCHCFYKFSLIC